MTSTTPDTKGKIWPVVALVLSVLTLLLGGGVVYKIAEIFAENEGPQFAIRAINTLARSNTYEITNHIIWLQPSDPITPTWGIEVIPRYRSSKPLGEVRVLVKNQRGAVLAQKSWNSFDKDSKPILIALDPYILSKEVKTYWGFRENIFQTDKFTVPEAVFDIEVVQASLLKEHLASSKLTLKNAPWYHYTAMSDWHEDSIDVFVRAKNIGEPSDFVVVSAAFEVSKIPGTPYKEWPCVSYLEKHVPNVSSGQAFSTTLSFPDSVGFKPGSDYLVETYLVKKQNYIQFADGAWKDSVERWRLGGFSTSHLISHSQ